MLLLAALLVLLLGLASNSWASIPALSAKEETDCVMRQHAISASNALLPACRLWDMPACQAQMDLVHQTLQHKNCALVKPAAKQVGASAETSSLLNTATAGNTVYVSPTGSDSASGADRTQALRTLERALEVVAAWNRPTQQKEIRLLPGHYPITRTVTVRGGEDSPALNKLNIRSDNSTERAVLTGLVTLDGLVWQPHAGEIIKATLTPAQAALVKDFSQLFINGKPAIRARSPNVQRFTDFAYSQTKAKKWGKGKVLKTSKVIRRDMTPPGVKYMANSPSFNQFSLGFLDTAQLAKKKLQSFEPPVSYFFDPKHQAQGGCKHTLPVSVTFKNAQFASVWKKPTLARFHALHWYGWGLWSFFVKAQTSKSVTFGPGGWQEARGDCGKGGQHWFVDNALELLDSPNEFFLDLAAQTLYYLPESAAQSPLVNPNGVVVELGANLDQLLKLDSVTDLALGSIEFRGAYETMMKPFEVPSGGDWSLHRSAALFIHDSKRVLVEDCSFQYNAGNALMVNGDSQDVHVNRNEFYALGSSAVLVVGDPGYFSDEPWIIKHYPKNIVVSGNVMSHFGLNVKQSSGVFVSLAKQVTVVGNVMYNGPRAGITLNDQFGGGHLLKQNLVMEQTLETADNGPTILWHRQQFQEDSEKAFDVIEDNFFLGSLGVGIDGGTKGINVDDGAFKVKSRNNVVVWGFHKIKGAEVEVSHNLFVNPLVTACVYFSYYTRTPSNLSYHDNVCVTSFPPYAFGIATKALPGVCETTNFQSMRNTFYYDGKSNRMEKCATDWQTWTGTYGQDLDSQYIRARPTASSVGELVLEKLVWIPK